MRGWPGRRHRGGSRGLVPAGRILLGWLAGLAGQVGWHGGPGLQAWRAESGAHCWPGWQAWLAGSAGMAGRVDSAEVGGQAGSGWDSPGGAVGAGRVGQGLAVQSRSSSEHTYEWFLEMCVPLELAHGIKLVTMLGA